jgi:hypothetical protein
MLKKTLLFVFLFGSLAFSQTTSYLEILKSDVRTQRRALITGAMSLTEEQAQKFWPVYKEYESETDKLFDRELELIKKYADMYKGMSDEMADMLLNEAMDIDQEQLDLNKKYYNKMKKELGAKVSAKFRMVDNRINLMMNLQIAASVPVIE